MILQKVLLIDTDYVKQYSTVSENMDAKYVTPCIVSSQVQDLQQLIGTPLSVKLCELVDDETIDDSENAAYKDLLDEYVKPYLLACTQAELIISNMMKIRRAGDVQFYDTSVQNADMKMIQYQHQHYADQATFLGNRMTDWLKCHMKDYPEYRQFCACKCDGMSPKPESSINCPIVL